MNRFERRAAMDDYLADMAHDRRKREHEWGVCDRDKCEWCVLEELAEAVLENQKAGE